MRKWKQKIASALIVSLMLGTVSAGSAFAEEDPGKRYWELSDEYGGWVFWRGQPDGDGNWRHTNRVVKIKEKRGVRTYCFGEDGVMNSDEVVDLTPRQYKTLLESQGIDPDSYVPEAEILDEDEFEVLDGEVKQQIYVYPDGDVAFDEWVVLEDGERLAADPDEENCGWYYFGKDGFMVKNREVEMNPGNGKQTFRLDGTGKMISGDFAMEKLIDAENGLKTSKYYNHMGEMIAKKKMHIGDEWYQFDDQGYYRVDLASDSDAMYDEDGHLKPDQPKPEPDMVGVTLPDGAQSEIKTGVGKEVKLDFVVTLASDSNVVQDWSFGGSRHDIWKKVTLDDSRPNLGVKSYKMRARDISDGPDPLTKIITTYFTANIPCEAEIRLVVDDEVSYPYYVTANVGDAKKGEVIETMLSSLDGEAGQMNSALNPILVKENISEMFAETDEAAVRGDMKQTWMKQKAVVEKLDGQLEMANKVRKNAAEVSDEALDILGDADPEAITALGAALNAEEGQSVGLAVAEPGEKPELGLDVAEEAERLDVDISFLLDGSEESSLNVPVILNMPLPAEFAGKQVTIYHTPDGGETEKFAVSTARDGIVSFVTDEFSTYTFVAAGASDGTDNDGENGGSEEIGGSGDPGSISSDDDDDFGTFTTGSTTTDSRKGYVSSVTGIITGSGDGYSQWIFETPQGQPEGTVSWKLQYADGTYAAGSYLTDAEGNPVKDEAGNRMEQPAWELVDGAWFAFGADGYAKSGFAFDPALNGWFYLDIRSGMKTGWQSIDGKWYYFNPVSDGTKGMMLKDKMTPDGYYVDENGVWNEGR